MTQIKKDEDVQHMAMRPVHIGKISEKLMQQAYTLWVYFWIYDLEEDNTFDRDREKLSLLKNNNRQKRLAERLRCRNVFGRLWNQELYSMPVEI